MRLVRDDPKARLGALFVFERGRAAIDRLFGEMAND
jgi:hypothetical protein